MNISANIETMFEIPPGHTPKILIGGGATEKSWKSVWEGTDGENAAKGMDEAASKLSLPLSPVMVLLVQGDDGHVDTHISLPLQKWREGMRVEESIDDTNDLKRITDWCAGFLHSFCSAGSVAAYDLATNQIILGKKEHAFDIASISQQTGPKKEARVLESIGSVDDILAGLLKREPSNPTKVRKVPVKDETPEAVVVPVVDKDAEARKQQQDIKDKYGIDALKDILARSKKTLLIEEA